MSWFEDYVLNVIFNNFDIRLQNLFFTAIACLSLSSNAERRKKIMAILAVWVEMCTIVNWLLTSMMAMSSLRTYRPRFRSYSSDFYAKRDYVKCLVHDNDESCISQVKMNRVAFYKLCEMLKNIGRLKPTRNMAIDE